MFDILANIRIDAVPVVVRVRQYLKILLEIEVWGISIPEGRRSIDCDRLFNALQGIYSATPTNRSF